MSRVINRCVVCGRAGRWGKYCSSACKQKSYRTRLEAKRAGAISGTSSMLIDMIGLDASLEAFEYLNSIDGKGNQHAAANAIEVIIYAVQSKINHMIAESRD